ncbi:MAG: 50S ribosomal protein L17 [Verrucomicrobiota bacterium]
MRHRKNTVKLGRPSQHRDLMLANLVSDLITHNHVTTTLARAKAMRPLAERMVTLGKKGTLHHRRLAVAKLRQKAAVKKLFADLAPRYADRPGGYTRITKLGPRNSDAAPMAYIEWVEAEIAVQAKQEESTPQTETAPQAQPEQAEPVAAEEPKTEAADAPQEEAKAETPAAEPKAEAAVEEPKADDTKEEEKK